MSSSGQAWWRLCSAGLTEADRRNSRRAGFWILAWGLSFAAVNVLLRLELVTPPLAYLAILAPTALGVKGLAAVLRFLREADELLRKIHVEALAFSFGAGAVFILTYRLLERLGAPVLDSSDPIALMMILYCAGLWWGQRKYY